MENPDPAIPTETRTEARRLLFVGGLFFGTLLAWGLLTELDSGAIAPGEVIPAGRLRTVQTLDGGIIRAILVKEGDRVREGDELLRFDETDARSALAIATREIAGLEARLADTRREASHWQSREASIREIATNAEEESRINRRLYEQNFISKPRLLQLESQKAQTAMVLGENAAELARARQKIAETEAALAATRERRAMAQERLARIRITAPQDGVVQGLRFTTLGGVVPPGGAILDVVPESDQLVVEAKILPDDIDVVWAGLEARVKLTAYKARSHITLKGRVTQVSGSTFRDEGSQGRPYYKARIEIGAEELAKIERGALMPGMLAEVDIVAGRRTALRYLFDPVLDSMRRAFKEA